MGVEPAPKPSSTSKMVRPWSLSSTRVTVALQLVGLKPLVSVVAVWQLAQQTAIVTPLLETLGSPTLEKSLRPT